MLCMCMCAQTEYSIKNFEPRPRTRNETQNTVYSIRILQLTITIICTNTLTTKEKVHLYEFCIYGRCILYIRLNAAHYDMRAWMLIQQSISVWTTFTLYFVIQRFLFSTISFNFQCVLFFCHQRQLVSQTSFEYVPFSYQSLKFGIFSICNRSIFKNVQPFRIVYRV